ncbi:MAG: nitrophenyl compound nitroreductase subunit ArsF family protein [Dehalococcoidia bacterium]|nr:nitrophenyl compound nitroreductase subunit ArsF family protein [Dehalococcoidia bacterium]
MTMLAKAKIWSAFLIIILVAGMLCACGSPAPEAELSTYHMEIDLLGAKNAFWVDSQGRLKTSIEASSGDGKVSLSIDEGTAVLDKDGKAIKAIYVVIDQNLPPPPEGAYIIGTVYDLGPRGTNFEPPIMLTLSYDLEEIPEGVKESNVYIAPYDEHSGWGMQHYKRVDTKNHRVTTQIDYSTKFAILAPIEQPTSEKALAPVDRVEVIYFHRAQRCQGCIYAEAGTRYTLETYFKDKLASGKVTFEAVNVEAKENAAIVKKYGAFTSSLFINTVSDGTDHIEEVTDIWLVLGKDEAFVEVVKNKIEKSLGEIE